MKTKSLLWLLALSTCVTALGAPGQARAERVRAVLLVKHTLDGKVGNEAALETAALAALAENSVRAIELDAALSSQKALFSDLIQAGTLPLALSTLNADAFISVQLACDKSGEKLLGSGFQSYSCALSTKVVRVDTADVVFSRTASLTSHGLNAAMAVQALLRTKVPSELASQHKEWLAAWGGGAGFSVDLMIAGVHNLSQRDQLREQLAQLPGVVDVQSVYFRESVAKLTVLGQGEREARALPSAIEASQLALRITREAGRTLYAQVDAGKAYERAAVFYLELPAPADPARPLVEEVGPDILQAALRNLAYLSPVYSRPLSGAARPNLSFAKPTGMAASAELPLLVAARVRLTSSTWTSQLTVSDGHGATIAAGSATGIDMAEAMQASARVLDGAMQAALAKLAEGQPTGRSAPKQTFRSPNPMVVDRFQVRGERDGLLDLRNTSRSPLSDCTVELKVAGVAAGELRLPDLPPGKARTFPISFATLPRGLDEDEYTNVSATVRYRAGEAYGDTRADAVWMRGSPGLKTAQGGPHTGDTTPAYLKLTQQGVAASREGDWQRAKTLFLQAHKLQPTARTLRALGMVSFDLGEYEQASRYLREALASKVKALTPTMEGELRDLLERATQALARATRLASKGPELTRMR